MSLICCNCGRDIDAIGQDNMSCVPGMPICEDCASTPDDADREFHEMESMYLDNMLEG